MGSLWPAPTGRCASFGGLLGFSFRLSCCLPLCWYAANSNLHQGLWWTKLPTVVTAHCSGFLLIFGVGCCCAKPPLPSSDFMTSILLHLPHNPLVWMEMGRSWARRQAGGGLMLGQQGSGKTGRLHNLLLLLHTALAGAHCCRELRAQNWQHRPTLLLSPTALDLP